VIIPHRRPRPGLAEALRSVRAQRYPGPVTAVVVHAGDWDPGVLDGPPGSVIPVRLEPPHQGNDIAARRNAGLAATDHEVVAFLDDDDLWHPDKLRRQVEVLTAGAPTAVCATGFTSFVDHPAWPDPGPGRPPVRRLSRTQILRARHLALSSVVMPGPVARRLRFDERPEWFAVEDLDLWIRASDEGPVVLVDQVLTGIGESPGSASRRDLLANYLAAIDVVVVRARDRGPRPADLAVVAERVARLGPSRTVDPGATGQLVAGLSDQRLGGAGFVARAYVSAAWALRRRAASVARPLHRPARLGVAARPAPRRGDRSHCPICGRSVGRRSGRLAWVAGPTGAFVCRRHEPVRLGAEPGGRLRVVSGLGSATMFERGALGVDEPVRGSGP
jgi:hypothetical protein